MSSLISNSVRPPEAGAIRTNLLSVRSLWRRLPVVLRATLTGVVVSQIGLFPWLTLVVLNLRWSPGFPWCVPVMAAYLTLFWRYFGGWGWPDSTAESRRERLRGGSPEPAVWRWSLLFLGATIAFLVAFHFVAARLVRSPQPSFPDFSRASTLTTFSLLVMIAIVAGVVEEAAYRGYMQGPIERRHGPLAGILVVALFFALIHVPNYRNGPSWTTLASLLIASLAYGAAARFTGSILPGVVMHAVGNTAGFLLAWWFRIAAAEAGPVPLLSEAPPDALVGFNVAACVLLAALAVFALRRLAASRVSAPTGTSGAALLPSRR